ncbi:MAG: rhomboid family intramembrane serine protease [Lachnospiraceae bacterium]|nr:rhomboid family intramembrane serine protease [Lachnospiraceae bacterium]
MIEEQLDKLIASWHFNRIEVNVGGIKIYFREQEGCCNILTVYYFPERQEVTEAQQEHIRQQIREHFFLAGMPQQEMLSLVVTEDPQSGRHLFREGEKYWIWNALSGQLMLFEDQSGDFCGIRKPLEQQMHCWYLQVSGIGETRKRQNRKWSYGNLALVVCNVLIFLICEWMIYSQGNTSLLVRGALRARLVLEEKEYYRLLSYMFLHGGAEHLFNNMLILFFIGNKLEQLLGSRKYLFVYFATGILAGITSMGYNTFIEREISCVGASGAIFGAVGAMAAVILLNRGKVADLTGRQMLLFILLSLYGGFTSQGVDNAAHIGGLVAGFVLALLIYRRPAVGKKRDCDEG